MRRTITRSVILMICFLFVLSMIVALYLRSKQPHYKGELSLSILETPAEVLFDKWAIPHIYADNEIDAYRSLGYLHAQERLFQMEIMRRLAKGELSEILGPDVLKYDKLFRTVGIRKIADKLAKKKEQMDVLSSKAFDAYIEGINEFINKGPVPIEFQILGIKARSFEVSDSFAIAGYMAFTFINGTHTDPLITYLETNFGDEFKKEILPKRKTKFALSEDEKVLERSILFAESFLNSPFDCFRGSNGWAVSGSRTRSGKPMLANDPHIGYSSPSVWFEASMEYPSFKLYGHYLAGVPFALLGHGDKHAWGLTMLQNKDIDFYKEKINPKNPKQVWFVDSWEDLDVRTEIIKVKGGEDVELVVTESRHGPFIHEVMDIMNKIDTGISLHWNFNDEENRVFEALYQLGRSYTVKDAEQATSLVHSPGFNVIYANEEGDIAWWAAARMPIRPEHMAGKFLHDGSSGKDEYEGYYPFSTHPMLVNPSEGFIVTANQNPFRHHPYEVAGYYNADFRYDEITKHLASKDSDWSVDDMKLIQLRTENNSYKKILASLLPLIESEELKKDMMQEAVFTLLKNWDFQHSIESQGASIFHEFIGLLIEKVFGERVPDTFLLALKKSNFVHEAIVRIFTNEESVWWKNKAGDDKRQEWVLEAWNKMIENLRKSLGEKPMQWKWGRVHTVTHKHLLGQSKLLAWLVDIGPLSAEGSTEVINNFSFTLGSGLHEVNFGPSTRRVIDFSNPGETWGINPTGQSGYFMNSHYKDQVSLYHQGEYRLQILDKKALKEAKRLLLVPAKKPEVTK